MTPPEFHDLFCLCLYWQWDEDDLSRCWTTVDKVARILNAMGLLGDKEWKALFRDQRLQHLFLRHGTVVCLSVILPPVSWSHNRGRFEDWDKRRDELLARRSRTLINVQQINQEINREQLLRNYRIFLTREGAAYARKVEPKYAALIDKQRYVAKCEQLNAGVTDAAMAAMCERYRQRVEEETASCHPAP